MAVQVPESPPGVAMAASAPPAPSSSDTRTAAQAAPDSRPAHSHAHLPETPIQVWGGPGKLCFLPFIQRQSGLFGAVTNSGLGQKVDDPGTSFCAGKTRKYSKNYRNMPKGHRTLPVCFAIKRGFHRLNLGQFKHESQ